MKIITHHLPSNRLAALDECSVLLITPLKKIICPKGGKANMRVVKIYKGITVIGAILGTGRVIVRIQQQPVRYATFATFLHQLKRQTRNERLHIVLDNASFHRFRKTMTLAEKLGFYFHFQPPYSPFLNAAEEIWRQLKEFIRGRLFTSLDALKHEIRRFFRKHSTLNINVANYFS